MNEISGSFNHIVELNQLRHAERLADAAKERLLRSADKPSRKYLRLNSRLVETLAFAAACLKLAQYLAR